MLRIFLSQGRKCGECGARVNKFTWHIDHIIPLSKGGSNWPTNIQILCQPCNLEKHASDPIDFARRKGRLI
ncbi:HNH endonuclease [Rhizobium binae]|nr:HNH endonuclease [Rhizobium binae]